MLNCLFLIKFFSLFLECPSGGGGSGRGRGGFGGGRGI